MGHDPEEADEITYVPDPDTMEVVHVYEGTAVVSNAARRELAREIIEKMREQQRQRMEVPRVPVAAGTQPPKKSE